LKFSPPVFALSADAGSAAPTVPLISGGQLRNLAWLDRAVSETGGEIKLKAN